MSGLFGGGAKTISQEEPRVGALRVQTSGFGMCVPVVFGTARVASNLIDYVDFTAIAHTQEQSSGGGKGGGTPTMVNTTYTYTVTFLAALCEGPILGVRGYWAGKDVFADPAAADAMFDLFLGTYPQSPWTYMAGAHPERALSYQGTAYVARAAYDLGASVSIPNFNFEVAGLAIPPGYLDTNAADVVTIMLTDPYFGGGWPMANVGDLTGYRFWCRASELLISPAFSQQEELHSHITKIVEATNAEIVWSEDQLKIIPYADQAVSGDGVVYTPNVTPLYDIDLDDFKVSGDEMPVTVRRKSPADAYNHVQVEFENRANYYNLEPAEAKDQADIETFGLRTKDPEELRMIKRADVARRVAQLKLQRSLYVRNEYEFYLGWRHGLLEPMDIVTLTEPLLGLYRVPVRLVSVEDDGDDDDRMLVVAEDFPFGVSTAPVYASQNTLGYVPNFQVTAGPSTQPVIFEGPAQFTGGEPQLFIAAAGGPNWAAAEVWISLDDATYERVGTVMGPARYGMISAALPAGDAIDTVNTLSVDLSISGGELIGGSEQNALDLLTACYVDGEWLSYAAATLTAPAKYDLDFLVRGAYGSVIDSHAVGKPFVRVDSAVYRQSYPVEWLGKVIYVKLRSLNPFGGGFVGLDEVDATAYAVNGFAPEVVTGFSVTKNSGLAFGRWDAALDRGVLFSGSLVVRHTAETVTPVWEGGVQIAVFSGATVNGAMPLLTGTYMAKWRSAQGRYSAAPALFEATDGMVTGFTTVATSAQAPGFTGTKTGTVLDGGLTALRLTAVPSSGEYLFAAPMDLTTVATRRFELQVVASSYEVGVLFDDRIGLVDSWGDWDGGSNINQCEATLYARTTDDDPAGSPVWGAWTPFVVADFTCRALQFKLVLSSIYSTHNIAVSTLTVRAKEPI